MTGEVVVLGAGLAGLSAAHHLGNGCEVFEKEAYVGGHARSKRVGGFCFDEGAHVFFGSDECSQRFVWEPLGREMVAHEAEIWNNYGGRRLGRYPVQVNAHALPPELATRCVLDFIEAQGRPETQPRTYEDWCRASFGNAFADNFMLRYARKVWTVEPSELTTEWLGSKVGGRISRPSLEQVVRGAVDPEPQVLNYLTRFSYPRDGGFGRIVEPLAARVPRVSLGNGLARLDTRSRRLTLADGSVRRYDVLISTVPLPALVASATDAPEQVRRAASDLMWTSIRCVNLGVARPDVGPGHWVYFYDEAVPFFRISFPSKFAPGTAPDGQGSISCEIAYSRRRSLREEDLVERVVSALRETGILAPDDRIVLADQLDIPYAYVVFDFARTRSLEVIRGWMEDADIVPCGRFGEWGYHWSFEAIESGKRVAEAVAGRLAARGRR